MIIRRKKKDVFQLNMNPCDLKKPISKKEEKVFKEMARLIEEALAVVFEEDLTPGWDAQILAAGRVYSSDGKTFDSMAEIKKEMNSRGEVCFLARNGRSLEFVRTLCIPKRP